MMNQQQIMNSFYALKEYPLYRFASKQPVDGRDGQLRTQIILTMGALNDALPMLRAVLWCGQMIGYRLHVRIVCDHANELRRTLSKEMPLLEAYSNIRGKARYPFVEFEIFEDDRIAEAACTKKKLNSEQKKALGRAGEQLAMEYEADWTAVFLGESTPAFMMRYCFGLMEDKAKALMIDCRQDEMDSSCCSWIHQTREALFLRAAAQEQAQRDEFRSWLTMKAYRHHLLYAGNMHGANNVDDFDVDESNNLSSCAAALHMAYKIKSIGLDPDADLQKTAQMYAQLVLGEDEDAKKNFGALTALEHRRWMMYQAVNGWRIASMDDIRSYCFTDDSPLGIENYRYKIDHNELKLHPALVAGAGAMCLNGLTHEQWDHYQSDEEIDNTDFDDLAKVSLKLHMIAGEKMRSSEGQRNNKLNHLKRLAGSNQAAIKAYNRFHEWFVHEGMAARTKEQEAQFGMLRREYIENGIASVFVDNAIGELKKLLKIVYEFYSYNDYEQFDCLFIEYLAEIYCRPQQLTLVKICASGKLDNIASTLLLEPDTAIIYGIDEENAHNALKLIQKYTTCKNFRHVEKKPHKDFKTLVERMRLFLKGEVKQAGRGGLCVVDVTGASDEYVSAVFKARESSPGLRKVAMIRCSGSEQKIYNMIGFPAADACRRRVSLTVRDILYLYNATSASGDESKETEHDLLVMKRDFPNAWAFFLDDRNNFELFGSMLKEGIFSGYRIEEGQEEALLSKAYPVGNAVKTASGIRKILTRLEELAVIRRFSMPDDQIVIDGSPALLEKLRPLMERLSDGEDNELEIVQSNTGDICIGQRKKKVKKYEWTELKGKHGSEKVTLREKNKLTYTQISHLKILLDQMKREGEIGQYKLSEYNSCSIPGERRVINVIRQVFRDVENKEVNAKKLVYDAVNHYIYESSDFTERNDGMEGRELPKMFSGIAARDLGAFLIIENNPSAHKEYKIRKKYLEESEFSDVLKALVNAYAKRFFAEIREDILNPGEIVLSIRGEKWIVDALHPVVQEVTRGALKGLVFCDHCIRPRESRACRVEDVVKYRSMLRRAAHFHVIENLVEKENAITFDLVNQRLSRAFKNLGMPLEIYAYYEAARCFDDVVNGFCINWGENTDNELDVLAVKGMQLMAISCKATKINAHEHEDKELKCKYNMYEIRLLSNQLSSECRAVLLYLSREKLSRELENRAKSIGVSVLVLDENGENEIAEGELSGMLMDIMA